MHNTQIGYRYDLCFPPVEGQPGYLDDCYKLCQGLYNQLVAIQKKKNKSIEQWRCTNSPLYQTLHQSLQTIQDEIAAIYKDIKAANQKVMKRLGPTEEQQRRIDQLKDKRKLLSKELTGARRELNKLPTYKEFLEPLNMESMAEQRAARKNAGLHWGHYNGVFDQLIGEPFPNWKVFQGVGEGRLVMQFQLQTETPARKGRLQPTWSDFITGHPRATAKVIYRHKKKGDLVELTLTWGPKEPPVTCTFWLHRPIPDDARITNLYLIKRKVGYKAKWSLSFVLKRTDGWVKGDCAPEGWCAVDWNYRQVEGGLRVAYYLDHQGKEGELILPQYIVDRDKKARELQSLRDHKLNELMPGLAEVMPGNPPEWFMEATRTITQWESQSRYWRLWQQWKDNRFPGDETAFSLLSTWQEREQHLSEWQDNQRKRVLRQRQDLYRKWVAQMRRHYHKFILEDCNLAEMNRLPEPDQANKNPALKHNRKIAAPGSLIAWIKSTVAEVQLVDAKNTSKTCHCCRKKTEWNGELIYTCEHCREKWDCDSNAVHNMAKAAQSP